MGEKGSRGTRLIPARAGNTAAFSRSSFGTPAHPRSRGEHSVKLSVSLTNSGSSPLARGTRTTRFHGEAYMRLIPARAGNTLPLFMREDSDAAHPRSRGEHDNQELLMAGLFGSSPLARGTLLIGGAAEPYTRLIPARAGNTPHALMPRYPSSAHPRSRGEHVFDCRSQKVRGGSSPLARGTLGSFARAECQRRLIPARAGNTADSPHAESAMPAHPRSRGEHSRLVVCGVSVDGSSPLARGTRRVHEKWRRVERLIPARAGNTDSACGLLSRHSAHPRSRGEHSTAWIRVTRYSGSSPLARGTRRGRPWVGR